MNKLSCRLAMIALLILVTQITALAGCKSKVVTTKNAPGTKESKSKEAQPAPKQPEMLELKWSTNKWEKEGGTLPPSPAKAFLTADGSKVITNWACGISADNGEKLWETPCRAEEESYFAPDGTMYGFESADPSWYYDAVEPNGSFICQRSYEPLSDQSDEFLPGVDGRDLYLFAVSEDGSTVYAYVPQSIEDFVPMTNMFTVSVYALNPQGNIIWKTQVLNSVYFEEINPDFRGRSIRLSPDGKHIVAAGRHEEKDTSVVVVDAKTGKLLANKRVPFEALEVSFSPSGSEVGLAGRATATEGGVEETSYPLEVYNLSLERLWQTNLKISEDAYPFWLGLVDADTAIICTGMKYGQSQNVFCLDKNKGRTWSRSGRLVGVKANNKILVCDGGTAYCLDGLGKQVWQAQIPAKEIADIQTSENGKHVLVVAANPKPRVTPEKPDWLFLFESSGK